MDPEVYLCSITTQIEILQHVLEVREDQVADWTVRAAMHEERRVAGLSAMERGNLDRLIDHCVAEAERVGRLLLKERDELERLERAKAALEGAGFEV